MPVYDKEGKEITDITAALSAEEFRSLVTTSEPYQKVLSETIERRKALKEARAQLDALNNEQPEEKQKPVAEEPKPTPQIIDEDALVEKTLQKLEAKQQAVSARDALVEKVMKANNLPLDNKNFKTIVSNGSTEEIMNSMAAALAQSVMKVDTSTGGNGETGKLDEDALFAALDKKLFKDKSGNK